MGFKPRMAARIPVDLGVQVDSDAGNVHCRVIEASLTGILLWSENPLTPKQMAELTVDLGEDGSIRSRGTVLHSRVSDYPYPEGGYLAGVHFVNLSENGQTLLKTYLHRHRYSRFRLPKFR